MMMWSSMTSPPESSRRGPGEIEWVPWSELGPAWIEEWATAPDPEHVEVTGQTGSGKTYWLIAALQARAARFGDREILVVSKAADNVFSRLGWPVTDRWEDVRAYRQVIFWPQTAEVGRARKAYHDAKIRDLLERLWVPDSNVVVAFDEIGYLERLSAELRDLVDMYWREARSLGITITAMKQRPVWVNRSQHSETRWKVVFPPADRADMRRFAELLGPPREWEQVLDALEAREFVLRYAGRRDGMEVDSYVSWIDEDLRPLPAQADQSRRAPAPQYRKGR